MKDEIKEILAKLNKIVPYAEVPKELAYMTTNITPQECKILLDNITNLQEKYERMKENAEILSNGYNELEKRNEKAIDKIQYIIDYGFDYDGFNTVESLKGLIDMLVDYARQSKNILQESDKDEKEN